MSKDRYFPRKLDPDSPNGPRDIDMPEMIAGAMQKRSLLVFAFFVNHPNIDPDLLYDLQFDGWVNRKGHFWNREELEELLSGFYKEVWGIEGVDVSKPPDKDESFSKESIGHALDYIEENGGRGDLETKYTIWKKSRGRNSKFFIPGLRQR